MKEKNVELKRKNVVIILVLIMLIGIYLKYIYNAKYE